VFGNIKTTETAKSIEELLCNFLKRVLCTVAQHALSSLELIPIVASSERICRSPCVVSGSSFIAFMTPERFEDKAKFHNESLRLKDFFSAFVRCLWDPATPWRAERHQKASSTSFSTRPATLPRS
jgi:hypothetical protein